MNKLLKIVFVIIAAFLFAQKNNAQSVRDLVNDGVEKYEKGNFADSEVDFKKGLAKDNQNFQGYFNLGDALYKQGRYDDAIKSYQNSLQFTKARENQAKVFHNIGNSLLKANKLKESVEAYKNALKNNPEDMDTKYNLSYALNKMKQQDKQNKDKNDKNKDNKDKNKDKNKQDQNKDQNKDQDKKDDKQNKDQQNNQDQQKQDPQKNDQQQQQQQQQQDKMSKQEAERILNALKNNEADLQKELRKHKGKVIKREKDW